jgi:serine/threonine protein kinase/Tol biopolymer transport system component
MTPERWKLIGETYHEAIELDGDARRAFLERIGDDDADLRREVESLIKASEDADEFIENPALNDAARLLANRPDGPTWKDGMQIGHYRLKSLLGMGGMSEVYLALDIRLNRNVALKLLHPEAARDATARERLFREARAVAALSHENIVAIHSIEQVDDIVFIVMEYVEGETLADNLAEHALPMPALLDVGAQIASALQAAHNAGLIHRDIKPGNVLLTTTGQVKLLDFGIARLIAPDTMSGAISAEMPAPLTAEGRVLGTAAYMSPEQIRGDALDGRSDIFSLGALLYEAITGRPPFKGTSELSLTQSIIRDELIRPTTLMPDLPARIDAILERALSKDRAFRYPSASELARDLIELRDTLRREDISNRTTQPHVQNVSQAPDRTLMRRTLSAPLKPEARSTVAIVLVLLVLLGAFGFYKWKQRVRTVTPAETIITNTGNVANGVCAISPDGKYIAYALMDAPQRSSLWLRPTGSTSLVKLVPAGDYTFVGVTFSRDGNHIFFAQRQKDARQASLFKIPLLGGGASRVLDDVFGPVSFSPDGTRFVFRRGATQGKTELIVARSDGSEQRSIATAVAPEFFGDPSWSPDGHLIACSSGHSDGGTNRYVIGVSVDDWKVSTISKRKYRWVGNVEWLGDGRGLLMIATDTPADPYRVWRLAYPEGTDARVTSNSSIYSRLSVASNVDAMLVTVVKRSTNLWIDTLKQQASQQITFGLGGFRSHPSWTRAGIVIDSESAGLADISILDESGSNQRQLLGDLTAKGIPVSPVVTADGRYIVFAFDRTGVRHIWRMNLDGSDLIQLTDGMGEDQPACSPDGKWVVYTSLMSSVPTLSRVSIDGGAPSQITSGYSRNPAFSPDGKFLSYLSSESGRDFRWRITIIPSEGGEAVRRFEQDVYSTYPARWSRDGQSLAYIDPEQTSIWLQPVGGGSPKRATAAGRDLIFGFDWSPDGQRLAVVRGIWERDLVLIRDFR